MEGGGGSGRGADGNGEVMGLEVGAENERKSATWMPSIYR